MSAVCRCAYECAYGMGSVGRSSFPFAGHLGNRLCTKIPFPAVRCSTLGRTLNPKVVGSIPTRPIHTIRCSEANRRSTGRGFEMRSAAGVTQRVTARSAARCCSRSSQADVRGRIRVGCHPVGGWRHVDVRGHAGEGGYLGAPARLSRESPFASQLAWDGARQPEMSLRAPARGRLLRDRPIGSHADGAERRAAEGGKNRGQSPDPPHLRAAQRRAATLQRARRNRAPCLAAPARRYSCLVCAMPGQGSS
jgi:hypothetical protein